MNPGDSTVGQIPQGRKPMGPNPANQPRNPGGPRPPAPRVAIFPRKTCALQLYPGQRRKENLTPLPYGTPSHQGRKPGTKQWAQENFFFFRTAFRFFEQANRY